MKYNTKGDWVINSRNSQRNDWLIDTNDLNFYKGLYESQVEWSTGVDFLFHKTKSTNKPYVNLYKEIMKLNETVY